MIDRRKYFKVLALILCFSLSGCTADLYATGRTYYNETVSSVLITQDNSTLVVMGDRYHYVMEKFGNLASIIKSPVHGKMEAKFSNFKMQSDNRFTGSLKILIKAPTTAEYPEALKLGFVKSSDGLILDLKLNGTRYLAGNIVPSKKYLLNNQYSILVREPEGVALKAYKIAATPIALAYDGTLVLAGVSLLMAFAVIDGVLGVLKSGG